MELARQWLVSRSMPFRWSPVVALGVFIQLNGFDGLFGQPCWHSPGQGVRWDVLDRRRAFLEEHPNKAREDGWYQNVNDETTTGWRNFFGPFCGSYGAFICRALLLIGFGWQFDSYRKGDRKKVLKEGEIEKFERQINRISLPIELWLWIRIRIQWWVCGMDRVGIANRTQITVLQNMKISL